MIKQNYLLLSLCRKILPIEIFYAAPFKIGESALNVRVSVFNIRTFFVYICENCMISRLMDTKMYSFACKCEDFLVLVLRQVKFVIRKQQQTVFNSLTVSVFMWYSMRILLLAACVKTNWNSWIFLSNNHNNSNRGVHNMYLHTYFIFNREPARACSFVCIHNFTLWAFFCRFIVSFRWNSFWDFL